MATAVFGVFVLKVGLAGVGALMVAIAAVEAGVLAVAGRDAVFAPGVIGPILVGMAMMATAGWL